MRLRRQAQEVDADRGASELFAEEAAAGPVVKMTKKGQTQERGVYGVLVLFLLVTFFVPVLYVTTQACLCSL